MKRFDSLANGEWADKGPWPHVLVLPHTNAYREFWAAHQPVWEPYDERLVPIPYEWTHITVESIRHRVAEATMDDLAAALAAEMTRIEPFTLMLGPSGTAWNGVTVSAYPELQITQVFDCTRAAMARVPGVRVGPRPHRYWPHTALAYCVRSFDSASLNAYLYRDFQPPRVDMLVDRIHLVWQRQLAGQYYTWEAHSEIPLGQD